MNDSFTEEFLSTMATKSFTVARASSRVFLDLSPVRFSRSWNEGNSTVSEDLPAAARTAAKTAMAPLRMWVSFLPVELRALFRVTVSSESMAKARTPESTEEVSECECECMCVACLCGVWCVVFVLWYVVCGVCVLWDCVWYTHELGVSGSGTRASLSVLGRGGRLEKVFSSCHISLERVGTLNGDE